MSGNTVISGIALGVIKVRDNIIYVGFFLVSMLPQYMALCVSQLVSLVSFVKKKISATSKQGRRLRFGMLIALTNIRSTKVLHHASCIKHHALQVTS